jgi:hypothetical protein
LLETIGTPIAAVCSMPEKRVARSRRPGRAPLPPKPADSEGSPPDPGHVIRGKVDYEDVLDRLSKGVSVPSDLTHKDNSSDKS